MINVELLIKDNNDNIKMRGYYKSFANIDELIRYCTSKSHYNFIYDYELVEEGK